MSEDESSEPQPANSKLKAIQLNVNLLDIPPRSFKVTQHGSLRAFIAMQLHLSDSFTVELSDKNRLNEKPVRFFLPARN
ncbi:MULTISPECIES: hypothetical protein [unclassified Pseudoalteromonas]|uniref:hypothetical protein n=1 Tax=unclassified Pseudoalteromonas TaxID=194690 RepID=UPI001BAA21B4|nr:hypothetical protein [Pseudoalteromonas sp. M8]QUI72121.1 hypothetical protein GSF13_21415 [Pseudoalteromonas sp. M8]